MKHIGIIAFTQRGKNLAEDIACRLFREPEHGYEAEVFDSENMGCTATEYLGENFCKRDGFLFICAAGIAVRMIAPLLKSKDVDPAVVVMDELGRYSIPVLSGHLGGANEMAETVAQIVGAEIVLTTATDINGKFAVDVWAKRAGCAILDVKKIKTVSSAVLRGEKVGISSSFACEGVLPQELTKEPAETGICISLSGRHQPFLNTMNVVPRIVSLGVGCRRGVSAGQFEDFILAQLSQHDIALEAVEKIASVDLKKDEGCIIAFSEKYRIPFVTYTPTELSAVPGQYAASRLVKEVTGVDNVCERSAVLASRNGRKLLSKTSGDGCTCALAVRDWKCKF